MANGIVQDPSQDWNINDITDQVQHPTPSGINIPGTKGVSAYEASRLESTPLMATGAVLDLPQYQGIATRQARDTSDKIINDWLNGFGVVSKERQSPVEQLQPAVAPITPTPVSTLPEGVVSFSLGAPNPVGDQLARDRIARESAASVTGIANQMNNAETLRIEGIQRQRGDQATADLEQQRQLGIVGPSGMSEYEANANRARGIVTAPAVQAARINAVSETARANAGLQSKIYESAIKSNEEWAKLGIQAQDVRSKQQYRQAMVDDLMTKTGLIEPMKLQLAQAKTSADQTKVKRDFAMKALDKLHEDQINEYRDTTMKMGGSTPELQQKFNQIETGYQTAVDNIMSTYPMEGDVRKFGDRIARFVNGKYVDITDQTGKGVVGSENSSGPP